MRIIATSDLHIPDRFGMEAVEKIAEAAEDADILLFAGDLANSSQGFDDALALFQDISIPKLYVLGNYCVRQLPALDLGTYTQRFSEQLARYGFHLLDHSPYVHGGTAFAGGMQYYDGSLWRPTPSPNGYPNTREGVAEWVRKDFSKDFPDNPGLTASAFLEQNLRNLESQIRTLSSSEDVERIFIATHYAPSSALLRYGVSPLFDLKHYGNGSERIGQFYDFGKVAGGVCGQVHEIGEASLYGKKVTNVCAMPDKLCTVLDL